MQQIFLTIKMTLFKVLVGEKKMLKISKKRRFTLNLHHHLSDNLSRIWSILTFVGIVETEFAGGETVEVGGKRLNQKTVFRGR
jgi:hypothetical protein